MALLWYRVLQAETWGNERRGHFINIRHLETHAMLLLFTQIIRKKHLDNSSKEKILLNIINVNSCISSCIVIAYKLRDFTYEFV
jgi:hypothetical protein